MRIIIDSFTHTQDTRYSFNYKQLAHTNKRKHQHLFHFRRCGLPNSSVTFTDLLTLIHTTTLRLTFFNNRHLISNFLFDNIFVIGNFNVHDKDCWGSIKNYCQSRAVELHAITSQTYVVEYHLMIQTT